jgi:tetratricopeptide (TPR) repeat protein
MSKKPRKNGQEPFTLPHQNIAATVAVPKQPKVSVEQALAVARKHQEAGKLREAENILRQILKISPRQPQALHLLGVVAHAAGKTALAMELVGEAIRIDGGVALFHANMAEMCRRSDRLEDAVKYGRKAVALDPKLVSGHGNLGIAYFDLEQYEKAEDCHRAALKINPNFAPSLNNMGSIMRQRKDYDGACKYFRAAIQANPNFLDPQNNLGETLARMEQHEESLKVLDGVLAKNPRYDSAHCNRGLTLLSMGEEVKARDSFVRALKATPDYPQAYAGLVLVSLELHKLTEGEKFARRLVELEPAKAEYHSMLGSVLLAQGLTEEAEAAFRKAIEMQDDCVPARAGLGHVLMEKGDLEEAEKMFRSCLKDENDTSPALYSLIQVRKMKAGDPEIAVMAGEAEKLKGKVADSKAIPLNFALGKMYDDLGDYDRAFPHYMAGCSLKRKKMDYSMEEKEKAVRLIKDVFTADFIAKNAQNGNLSDLPIFVLGMPRSGTTLTEQIIASHPLVHGAGELRDMLSLAESFPQGAKLPYPAKMRNMTAAGLEAMGREYVEGLRKRSPESRKITDKMPGNFHYIGLIKMILPNAKIVHVQRHPLDTCLSCFTRLFAHGQASTYDLTELGHYYKCYKGLMDHWRTVLPAGSFYDLSYEKLVDDTETESRKLIEYCGLEWDDSCLEFYKNTRNIRTASVTQVRQPIYKTSKQRWKNYEKFIGPLVASLGDALDGEI